MDNSKRKFLKRAGQSSAMLILFAYGGGKLLAANNPLPLKTKWDGLLLKDPKALFDLPKGFSYKVILSSGDIMSDGLKYGARPDGMGAFKLNDGSVALVVNHETKNKDKNLKSSTAYDTSNNRPYTGGTSTIVLESDGITLKRTNRSLKTKNYTHTHTHTQYIIYYVHQHVPRAYCGVFIIIINCNQ